MTSLQRAKTFNEMIRSRDLWFRAVKDKYGAPEFVSSSTKGSKSSQREPKIAMSSNDECMPDLNQAVSSPGSFCIQYRLTSVDPRDDFQDYDGVQRTSSSSPG